MGHPDKQAGRDRQKGRQMRQKGRQAEMTHGTHKLEETDRLTDRQTDETEMEERQR